jgi:hypothetical protein
MIRVEAAAPPPSTSGYSNLSDSTFVHVTSVQVNGLEARYITSSLTTILIALPDSLRGTGFLVNSVTQIRITRSTTSEDGDEIQTYELLQGEEGGFSGTGGTIDSTARAGSKRVTIDGGILELKGKRFDKAVAVRVNKNTQDFTILDRTTILCTLPKDAYSIEDVEVITTSTKINRSSLFAYLFTETVNTVSAEFKLVQQFVKVLLTTPGTNVFEKGLGGDLQHWVGINVPLNSPTTLVTKTVLNVVTTGIEFSARQVLANVPPEERLSDVEVLNVGFDKTNPSVMDLSIRLNTFSKRQATISLMIGTAQEAISGMVEDGISAF